MRDMLTDVAGLTLALFAILNGRAIGEPLRTYGYYRVEILAALANAVVLLLVSGFSVAARRPMNAFDSRRRSPVFPMFAVAVVGLLVNAGSIMLLRSGSSESLNLKVRI